MTLSSERRSDVPGEESAPFISETDNKSDLEQDSLLLSPTQARRWRGLGYLLVHAALILFYTVLFVVFTFRKRGCGAPSLRNLSLYCMPGVEPSVPR
jgi:hypothetical protein